MFNPEGRGWRWVGFGVLPLICRQVPLTADSFRQVPLVCRQLPLERRLTADSVPILAVRFR